MRQPGREQAHQKAFAADRASEASRAATEPSGGSRATEAVCDMARAGAEDAQAFGWV